jgi:hypothetical protein
VHLLSRQIFILKTLIHFCLGVEVKKAGGESLKNPIKVAAEQTLARNQLLGRLHRNILVGPGWTYVRVVALPLVTSLPDQLEICDQCRRYVLDQTRLRTGLTDWLASSLGPAKYARDHQYENLVTRSPGCRRKS